MQATYTQYNDRLDSLGAEEQPLIVVSPQVAYDHEGYNTTPLDVEIGEDIKPVSRFHKLFKALRISKILIIFAVLMIGIIWFAMYDEVEHSYTFAMTKSQPLVLYLDDHLPKHFIDVSVSEPVDARSRFVQPQHLYSSSPSPLASPIKEISVEFQALTNPNSTTSVISIANATMSFKGTYAHEANKTRPPSGFVFRTPNEYIGSQLRLVLTAPHSEDENDASNNPFAIMLDITQHSAIYGGRVVLAFCVLTFVYILIIFELVDRTVATLLGAFLAISAMAVMNLRPTLYEMVDWVEFHTLVLLFGMMTIVAVLSTTGKFQCTTLDSHFQVSLNGLH
jgi:hypothetical protein